MQTKNRSRNDRVYIFTSVLDKLLFRQERVGKGGEIVDVGFGTAKGDVELKYKYIRGFIGMMSKLEEDKSCVGVIKLKLALLSLIVRVYVNKILDTTFADVVKSKLGIGGNGNRLE